MNAHPHLTDEATLNAAYYDTPGADAFDVMLTAALDKHQQIAEYRAAHTEKDEPTPALPMLPDWTHVTKPGLDEYATKRAATTTTPTTKKKVA